MGGEDLGAGGGGIRGGEKTKQGCERRGKEIRIGRLAGRNLYINIDGLGYVF